ncbi:hypothetical protein RV14_GL000615 [Enterococcus ratti]|uniref:Uncharacterized protein n=1 Tax=Enterococcus ratti TaxID=150033 RepID=A0A1L8WGV6_9ENTE|nr:hypothetical protein RV14_GL000615 [Enterococcus ratti]
MSGIHPISIGEKWLLPTLVQKGFPKLYRKKHLEESFSFHFH